jgi:chemotaxis protein CheC
MDLLKEVINIGMGEAAASLSELVNSRVGIQVPDVRVMRVDEIWSFLDLEVSTLGVYLSQGFRGPLTGKGILFYTEECSLALLDSLFGGIPNIGTLGEAGRATLQEVANIILVSCISRIGDMTGMPTFFDIPTVTVETSETYFKNLVKEMSHLEKAIVVKNEISVYKKNIVGYLFVLLGLAGFDLVESQMEKYLRSLADGEA